jgi:hypothetical protein
VEPSVAVSLCLVAAEEGRHKVAARDDREPGSSVVHTQDGKGGRDR